MRKTLIILILMSIFLVSFVSAIQGDLDGDGYLQSGDIVQMENLVLGITTNCYTYTGEIVEDCNLDMNVVDVNDNGLFNNADLLALINIIYENPLIDFDKDGYYSDVDCNELNSSIHPGAIEVYGNGVDEDCSGADFVLTGNVFDKDGRRIYNALISATCSDENGYNTTQNIYNDYVLNINSAGSCEITASKDGFSSLMDQSQSGIGFDNMDFVLDQNDSIAGNITGFVLSTPPISILGNAEVRVIDASTSEIIQIVFADVTGQYVVYGLNSLKFYNISSIYSGYIYPSSDDINFPPQYNVPVEAGQTNSGINLWMDELPT